MQIIVKQIILMTRYHRKKKYFLKHPLNIQCPNNKLTTPLLKRKTNTQSIIWKSLKSILISFNYCFRRR